MKFYDTIFFCGERNYVRDKGPIVHISYNGKDDIWPVTIRINSSESFHKHPGITIHMQLDDWINFKNSVLQADRQLTPKVLGREHYE